MQSGLPKIVMLLITQNCYVINQLFMRVLTLIVVMLLLYIIIESIHISHGHILLVLIPYQLFYQNHRTLTKEILYP